VVAGIEWLKTQSSNQYKDYPAFGETHMDGHGEFAHQPWIDLDKNGG